ncbi:hypothetical protein [Zooshikella harenae]|uniref:Uncharacterized protein n=1 Tax=Zooshikella harenae TaxID=2827238 RepID=A0ABS5ZEM1_9GAMM|nr:hypothetical protein [Zooshikella harenae]MBU2712511.1 hypothetical protein [Zooshikella harenae]
MKINKRKILSIVFGLSSISYSFAQTPSLNEAKLLNTPIKSLRWALKNSEVKSYNITDSRIKELFLVNPKDLYSEVRSKDELYNIATDVERTLFNDAEEAWNQFLMSQNRIPGSINFFLKLKKQLGYEKATSIGKPDQFILLQRTLSGVDEDIYNGAKDKIPGVALRAKYALAAQLMRDAKKETVTEQWTENGIYPKAIDHLVKYNQPITSEDLDALKDYLSFSLNQSSYRYNIEQLAAQYRLVRLAVAYRNDQGFFDVVCTKEGKHLYDQSYVSRYCLSDMTNKQLMDRWFPQQLKIDHRKLTESDQKPSFGQKLLEFVGVFFALDGLGAAFFDAFEALEATELAEAGIVEREELSVLESEADAEEALAAEEYQSQFCRI